MYLVVGFPIFNTKVFLLVIFLKEINQNYFFNLKMNIFYKNNDNNNMNTETYLQIWHSWNTFNYLMHFELSEIFLYQ